jgi:hypothetical protein
LKKFDIDLKEYDDWPRYKEASDPKQTEIYRKLNAALITMCDDYLGRILDFMDKHDMWQDTMLIVNTDHGFLLGEHDWWGKCSMPFYNEIANTPLFIWDPRCGVSGERRSSLVQTIDLPVTLLSYFNVEPTQDMQGTDLKAVIESNAEIRDGALFGLFGGHVNCTDGHYAYMRAPVSADNVPLRCYTHMPVHMKKAFNPEELKTMRVHPGFPFTKGMPVIQMETPPQHERASYHRFGTMLFDLKADPKQQNSIENPEKEAEMIKLMKKLMRENDAPEEQYKRLGI